MRRSSGSSDTRSRSARARTQRSEWARRTIGAPARAAEAERKRRRRREAPAAGKRGLRRLARGVDDDVVAVVARRAVERAPAGDQAERGQPGLAIHALRGERVLGDAFAALGDEGGGRPVLATDPDIGAGTD